MLNNLPAGTVTFLFTDIEGSTQLWERHPEEMKAALARHDDLLRRAVESRNGRVVKTTGDGAYAAFPTAPDATAAALAFQQALAAETWPDLAPDKLRARIGLHTGEAELRDEDYHGPTLNRTARIMSIGHGGQTLLSGTTAQLTSDRLPPATQLRDLGEHRLRGLSRPEKIFQLVAPSLPTGFPPLHSATRVVSLPQPPTGFIGRWEEVDDVLRLLDEPGTRLVTLIGPGGMGKTRLGIQAAATLAEREPDRFSDGVYFVSLAPVSAADGIAGTVAEALGFQFSPGEREPRAQLVDYLRGRKTLLLLDNFEHLLDSGGAVLPADISTTARDVSMLLTSRARLGIQGEQLYPVPGMRIPDVDAVRRWANPQNEASQFSALQLFTQTAGRIRPGFQLTRDNIADVARICHLVQGAPLGIELAANWLELLSTAEIAAEIDRSLDTLATELHGVPARQRSLRAVFESSWQLASERERGLLPVLSVFRAPFTREAAAAVAGAELRDLMALVNKSWLQRQKGADGVSRFIMHELLRQYAEEKLRAGSEAALVEERYARYYVALVARSKPLLLGADQLRALTTLAAEFDLIRFAWEWLVARGEFDTLVDQMLRPLQRYANMRGLYREVGELVNRALVYLQRSGVDHSPRTLTTLLVVSENLNYGDADMSSQLEEAWQLASGMEERERSLGVWYVLLLTQRIHHDPGIAHELLRLAELVDDDDGAALMAAHNAGSALSLNAENRPALQQSVAVLRRAGAMAQQKGDQWAYAAICESMARSQRFLGNDAEALMLLDEAQSIYETLGDWQHVAILAFQRSDYELAFGRPDLALKAWETGLSISQERGDRVMENLMLGQYSINTTRYGDIRQAVRLRERSLALSRELAFFTNEPWNLWELGDVNRVAGTPGEARRYYQEALAIFQTQGNRMGLAYHQRGLGDLALGAGDFGAAADHFDAAVTLLLDFPGEEWSRVYMIIGHTRALLGLQRPDEAFERLQLALSAIRLHRLLSLIPPVLATVAELALACDRPGPAAALCALLVDHPLTWNETRVHSAALAVRARAALGDAATAAEGVGLTLDPTDLAFALGAIAADEPQRWLDDVQRHFGLAH